MQGKRYQAGSSKPQVKRRTRRQRVLSGRMRRQGAEGGAGGVFSRLAANFTRFTVRRGRGDRVPAGSTSPRRGFRLAESSKFQTIIAANASPSPCLGHLVRYRRERSPRIGPSRSGGTSGLLSYGMRLHTDTASAGSPTLAPPADGCAGPFASQTASNR